MPDHTLEDERATLPEKPGLVNENHYTVLHLVGRAERPVEAEHDQHDLDHLEDAEGRQNGVQSVREARDS